MRPPHGSTPSKLPARLGRPPEKAGETGRLRRRTGSGASLSPDAGAGFVGGSNGISSGGAPAGAPSGRASGRGSADRSGGMAPGWKGEASEGRAGSTRIVGANGSTAESIGESPPPGPARRPRPDSPSPQGPHIQPSAP